MIKRPHETHPRRLKANATRIDPQAEVVSRYRTYPVTAADLPETPGNLPVPDLEHTLEAKKWVDENHL